MASQEGSCGRAGSVGPLGSKEPSWKVSSAMRAGECVNELCVCLNRCCGRLVERKDGGVGVRGQKVLAAGQRKAIGGI